VTKSPFEFQREPSHRCGVTLMDTQVGRAVAATMRNEAQAGVSVSYLTSMIRVDADRQVEFDFDALADAIGEEFDQNVFEANMTTHYGRMVAFDDRIVLFPDPEDAADYLGFDLTPTSS
jgi:propane monooxygenase coupling protein